MDRDFNTRRYIMERASTLNDNRVSQALLKTFDIMYEAKEPDGCLSNSMALYVALRSYGYDPKLCYGLCVTPEKHEIYHAWLTLNNMVLDLSIYGNSHFSPYWPDNMPVGTVVFEDYKDTLVTYGDHIFDENWSNSMISMGINKGTMENYFNSCAENGMWKLLFKILDTSYSANKKKDLCTFFSKDPL